jgi:hypothetical protein
VTARAYLERHEFSDIEAFHTYIENNKRFIPNDGGRYRPGEGISTGFVASTIDQLIGMRFRKKQRMAWTARGAHLCRCRVIDRAIAS